MSKNDNGTSVSVRLDDEQLNCLETIKKRLPFITTSQAIRIALDHYSKHVESGEIFL